MKFPLAAPRCGHCHHLDHEGATCDVTGCVCPEAHFVKIPWRRRFEEVVSHPVTRIVLELGIGILAIALLLWVLGQR